MKKLFLLVILGLLISGCAVNRVWKNIHSDMPTTKKEIDVALSSCELRKDVSEAHRRAKTWSSVCYGTFLIPFVGLGMCITSSTQWDTYETILTRCMQELGYYVTKERSNKLRWDKGSDFDSSETDFLEKGEKK